jgi:gas vesicle structural protein
MSRPGVTADTSAPKVGLPRRAASAKASAVRRSPGGSAKREGARTVAEQVLSDEATTLLDVVDHALTKGVVLTGDLTIGLAHVDLVYLRLSLLLCAADQVLPGEDPDPVARRRNRRAARRRQGAAAPAGTRRNRRG